TRTTRAAATGTRSASASVRSRPRTSSASRARDAAGAGRAQLGFRGGELNPIPEVGFKRRSFTSFEAQELPMRAETPSESPHRPDPVTQLGEWGLERLQTLEAGARFLYDCGAAALRSGTVSARSGFRELLLQLQLAGADALPLVAVLGFLTGVCLA